MAHGGWVPCGGTPPAYPPPMAEEGGSADITPLHTLEELSLEDQMENLRATQYASSNFYTEMFLFFEQKNQMDHGDLF